MISADLKFHRILNHTQTHQYIGYKLTTFRQTEYEYEAISITTGPAITKNRMKIIY